MAEAGHSIRLRVDLNSKKSIIISYPELLKQHEKTIQKAASVTSIALDKEQDSYYLDLLKRAAKYDLEPTGDEDNVDSCGEDDTPNKDGKADDYDYNDPFIDDSDMMLDDPFEYSPLEFDGFFVYHGALDGPIIPTVEKKKAATWKERCTSGATKLTSSSKAAAATKATPPTPLVVMAPGSSLKSYTKTHPIEIYSVEEETDKLSILMNPSSSPIRSLPNKSSSSAKLGMEIKGSDLPSNANSKHIISEPISVSPATNALWTKALSPMSSYSASTMETDFVQSTVSNFSPPGTTVPLILNPLPPRMGALMERLRHDRQQLPFENKSKFPPCLRAIMLNIGAEMFDTLHQVDDNVVAHLVDILPYNKFTMRKYLVTKSGPAAIDRFQNEIDQLIKVLSEQVKELMPEHIQRYEEKLLEQQLDPREDHPSVERKFRFSTAIRRTLYEVLTLEMYSSSIANEIAQLNNKPEKVVAEKSARRVMYAKLLDCWPQPWMTTYDISRQYSSYKLRMKNSDAAFTTQVSPSSSTADTDRRAPTGVKRSASPMLTALSSSPNVPQWTQMDTCRRDEKRKRFADTYNSPIAISSDEETDGEVFYGLSHDDHSNIGHLISNTLVGHMNDTTVMDYYNGRSSEPSTSSTQKSPFMNISSLISKP